jgi:capsular polysaccharide transport system permease protein
VLLQSAQPSLIKRLMRRINAVFVLTVLLPTLAAVVYYGVIASDVYIAESHFVVRSPQRPAVGGLGALLQGTVFSRSQDDTYSVHDFIRSRDALKELDDKLAVRKSYSSTGIDAINRFPGATWWDTSFEGLYKHYLRHVSLDYDTVSSITVLRVRAYTAADAQKVNELLLQMGERLVNNLNTRSRQDLIDVAEREVKLAEERTKAASLSLSAFRSDRSVYDPDRQSAIALQGVSKIQEELMLAEAQLSQIRQVSPNNPQIGALANRVENLRSAIANETAKVTGKGNTSIVSKSPGYDRLVLERAFADRQLATSLAALEQARSEAVRKQLYLERLVQPNLPDNALEPRRLRSMLMVFLGGLIVWGVVSLVLASIREHTD